MLFVYILIIMWVIKKTRNDKYRMINVMKLSLFAKIFFFSVIVLYIVRRRKPCRILSKEIDISVTHGIYLHFDRYVC